MTTTPYAPLTPDVRDAPLPPLAPGLPLLGHAREMYRNPILHMRDLYYRFGPIYRVRVPGREFTIMGGIEANQMLARTGDEYFISGPLFGDFGREMGTRQFMIALDGEEHTRLRRLMRNGYSRQALLPHLDEAVDITRRHIASWPVGGQVTVMDAMQRIVTEQIGALVIGHAAADYFEDLRIFMVTVLRTLVVKSWPRIMLKRPAYLRAKERIFGLARDVLEEFRNLPEEQRPRRNLIVDMLEYRDEHGAPMDEDALVAATVGPYLAGLDTVAGTLSFMVYAFLKHGVWKRLTAEADALFAGGIPDMNALRQASVLHAAVMETLRMYPVASFTPRAVAKPFVFCGHRVERGAQVLIANGLTHFLPEFFPNPDTFDLERHLEPRKEYRQAGAFAPFSLGPHTCLGAGMGEVQMMTIIATVLREVELALDPPDYQVQQALTPIPSPGFGFRVRVVRRRS